MVDISDPLILGLDFLEHFKVLIDLKHYSLLKHNNRIPAIMVRRSEKDISQVDTAKLSKEIVVPSFSEKFTKVTIDEEANTEDIPNQKVVFNCHSGSEIFAVGRNCKSYPFPDTDSQSLSDTLTLGENVNDPAFSNPDDLSTTVEYSDFLYVCWGEVKDATKKAY